MISFGLANEQGYLTNAGALIVDESPTMCSRLFCTRWNGLNKRGGIIDAFDDAEYSGSVISLIDNGEAFIKRNAKKMWRKTANSREEMPEYVEQNGKYLEYKEIPISADVNIVEGNYEPVLITHSYKANKNCDLLFGQTANKFTHDTWYEFYIQEGTFITY